MATPTEVKQLIEKFEKTIHDWPADGGLFLDLMREKLQQIKQSFVQDVVSHLPEGSFGGTKDNQQTQENSETNIYVALYQMQGDNIDRWATILGAIGMQGVSRPIYKNEADVINMIRHKEQPVKEGYAVVKVSVRDILPATNPPHTDKAGFPLLHVKGSALKISNVQRFVHKSGQYAFKEGKLVKLDLPSPLSQKTEIK